MKRELSIIEWHQMALDGNAPPIRIKLNGGSMAPLIRWKRDYVTIIPTGKEMEIGDIVLFSELNQNRYVVHRIWDIQDGKVQTWGDNCPQPDVWISRELIWGKVVLIERGRRKIIPETRKGIKWAKFWHHMGKIYRPLKSYMQAIIRRIHNCRA